MMSLLLAEPALADRHCAPVLDLYYQARHAILDEGAACEARLGGAVPRLEEAVRAARDCGCDALRLRVEALLEEIGGGSKQCSARSEQVLALADALDRDYEACL